MLFSTSFKDMFSLTFVEMERVGKFLENDELRVCKNIKHVKAMSAVGCHAIGCVNNHSRRLTAFRHS